MSTAPQDGANTSMGLSGPLLWPAVARGGRMVPVGDDRPGVPRFAVEPGSGGMALSAAVRAATGAPWTAVRRLVRDGRVTVEGAVVVDPGARLRGGQEVVVHPAAPRGPSPGDLPPDAVRHVDAHVVVLEKPSGMNTVPYEPGERGALVDRAGILLRRRGLAPANAPLFVVHRIDRETSGLVVFGRTWLAKRHLAGLFRRHDVERTYLALVHGHVAGRERTIESDLVADRGDGRRGSAGRPGSGRRAVTHLEVVARLGGPATLLRCRLETGRTHQIRIHVAEAGHPVIGERVYDRESGGRPVSAPRLMLHAATLGFSHPADPDRTLRFTSPAPADFASLATALGARPGMLAPGPRTGESTDDP